MSKLYHYTVRMISWPHSKEDFSKFRKWARGQKGFWWNHMGGYLDIFSFWASPEEVAKLFDEQGWDCYALSIDVGKGATPEEDR